MQQPPARLDLGGLVLRREQLGDEDLVASTVAANLEHLGPWMSWATREAATSDAQRDRLVGVEQAWNAGTDFDFLILDRGEVRLLGKAGLHRRVGEGGIEIGYWLAQTATGKGYATAAARGLTDVALDLDGISRVEIHCDEANLRSRRVPERLGYRLDRIEDDGIQAPAEVGRGMVWIYPP